MSSTESLNENELDDGSTPEPKASVEVGTPDFYLARLSHLVNLGSPTDPDMDPAFAESLVRRAILSTYRVLKDTNHALTALELVNNSRRPSDITPTAPERPRSHQDSAPPPDVTANPVFHPRMLPVPLRIPTRVGLGNIKYIVFYQNRLQKFIKMSPTSEEPNEDTTFDETRLIIWARMSAYFILKDNNCLPK